MINFDNQDPSQIFKDRFNLPSSSIKTIFKEFLLLAKLDFVLTYEKSYERLKIEQRYLIQTRMELRKNIKRFSKAGSSMTNSFFKGSYDLALSEFQETEAKFEKSINHLNLGMNQLKAYFEALNKDPEVKKELSSVKGIKKKGDIIFSHRLAAIRHLFTTTQSLHDFIDYVREQLPSVANKKISKEALEKRISRINRSKTLSSKNLQN